MAKDGIVSTTLSEWLLVILIIASLIFEFALHRLEHWIQNRHHHLVSVVRVLYRELMILGIVSFLFILYETVARPNTTIIHSFDFAHVFIFLLAIFYTVVVLSTMFTSLRLSAQWKKMEQMDLVHYLNLKDNYSQMRTLALRRHDAAWRLFWWFPNIVQLFRYIHMHEVVAFHDIRFQFIYYRNLPEDFRFSSFLRKIKSITFIELVESHWSLYLIFLAIVLGDILRRNVTYDSKKFDVVESVFISCAAFFLAICAQLLAVKIRRVYWQLTKHPRTYYEGVEANAVAEELHVRMQQQREARRSRSSRDTSMEVDPGNVADDESTALSVHPETELLDPMQPQPLSSSLNHVSSHTTESIPEASSTDVPNLSAHPFRPAPPTDNSILRPAQANVRASMDRPKVSFEALSQRALTDLQPSTIRNSPDDRVPNTDAIEDTLARHSLDVPRPKLATAAKRTGPPAPASLNASVARAAVEAARMRSAAASDTSGSVLARASMDTDRRSPKRMLGSPLVSRRTSLDGDARISLSDVVRSSIESRGRRGGGRVSIELAVVMPRDELAAQFEGEEDPRVASVDTLPHDDSELATHGVDGPATANATVGSGRKRPVPRIRFRGGTDRVDESSHVGIDIGEVADRNESQPVNTATDNGNGTTAGFRNPTILKNWEHQRLAQNTQPARYPRLVTKLIPRLGRVASPVEKLFWFGSHKFFLWCVEFVMFFSAVLLAAASAGLSSLPLVGENIRPLNIVALSLAGVNLLFVLFRIAGIMSRYIFILHNASLIPEVVAIEAIHNVREKRLGRDEDSSGSGSETEQEEAEAAKERRRRLGRFFRSEAESGNLPGIENESRNTSRTSWDVIARRKWRKRMALRRRNHRRLLSVTVDEDGTRVEPITRDQALLLQDDDDSLIE